VLEKLVANVILSSQALRRHISRGFRVREAGAAAHMMLSFFTCVDASRVCSRVLAPSALFEVLLSALPGKRRSSTPICWVRKSTHGG
jgi:hypothetical protein